MISLLSLFGQPETAHAYAIDQLGNGPGIDAMWADFQSFLPHSGVGDGVAFATGRILAEVSVLIGGAAIVVLAYAGVQIVLAGGDESKLGEAKKTAMYAIIGLVAAMMSNVLINYIAALVTQAAS